jgi:hypothetical protein
MPHLVTLIQELLQNGVAFRSLCDGAIDTTSASGELIFHIFSALAQFERRLIQERTKAGLSVENSIAEAVSFFNLNALSSSILVKVHFDVLMTLVADTLYTMLARKLRGFEDCDAPKLFRHFVKGKATIEVQNGNVTVVFSRRAHNPILRSVPWGNLPNSLPAYGDLSLTLRFS